MPPKRKFTRDEIVRTALDVARTDGAEAITARTLGARLGTSPKPIFSVFASMEQVQQEVVRAAKGVYAGYVEGGLRRTDCPAFKGVGLAYLRFAAEEPQLFRLLFMSPTQAELHYLPLVDDNYPEILASVRDGYGLTQAQAEQLYLHMGIYAHGLAVLCANRTAHFSVGESAQLLTDVFIALLKEYKGGNTNA